MLLLHFVILAILAYMLYVTMITYEHEKTQNPSTTTTPAEIYKQLLESPTLLSKSRARDTPTYGDIGTFVPLDTSQYYRLHGLAHEES